MASAEHNASTLNVSLEDHLVDTLRPLTTLLPEALAAELTCVLDNASSPSPSIATDSSPSTPSHHASLPTIPYALLTAISKWARSSAAERALASHEPPLRVQEYSMLALLAGTTTSPERKYPSVPPPSLDRQASRRRELGDRRAVSAVLNALLSIAGAGVATWWAAGRLAWRDEWKVLLALSVAIVVASSEGILYLIWEDRRSKSTSSRPPLRLRATSSSAADASLPRADKKHEPDDVHAPVLAPDGGRHDAAVSSATSQAVTHGALRGRTLADASRGDHPTGQDQ